MSTTQAASPVRFRIKTRTTNIPSNRAEAAAHVADVGAAAREIAEIETRLKGAIEEAKRVASDKLAPYVALRDARVDELLAYATREREALFGSSKTAELATGKLRFRLTPPAVTTASDEALIAELESRGLGHLVRIKKSLDRDAIKAAWSKLKELAVPGLSLTQVDEFVVEPSVKAGKPPVVTRCVD